MSASILPLGGGAPTRAHPVLNFTRRKSGVADLELAHKSSRLVQARFRGHLVRRFASYTVLTTTVARAVRRVDTDRRGFRELLLFLCSCVVTCVLFSLQYDVVRAFEAEKTALARVDRIVGPDGEVWQDIGISPVQVFGWLEAVTPELYERNLQHVVDLDKWADEEDGAEAAVENSTFAGSLGRRCENASFPACCRMRAWRKGMAAGDFVSVEAEHDFGHNRIASPLFVKLKRRARVACDHTEDEADPLTDVYPTCYSETMENTTRLVAEDGLHERDSFLWHEYNEREGAYLMPIDLGLYRFPVDHGLCHLERARAFEWIDTSASEVSIEFAWYNGQYELWMLTRVSILWTLGGDAQVTRKTLTASIRNVYSEARDFGRIVLEVLYLLFLAAYIAQAVRSTWAHGLRHNSWWMVDLASHTLSVLLVVLLIKFAVDASGFRLFDYRKVDVFNSDDGHHLWQGFVDNLYAVEEAANDFKAFTSVQSGMLMVLTLRLFKFLAFHQQFSIVTATLLHAAAPLAHFLVVFCIILVLYGFIGFNMLGHKMETFNSIGNAINSMCSLIVFDDTVSFSSIQLTAPGIGHVFYWSFYILSSLMLINVLLAILLDAYSTVSKQSRTANYVNVDIVLQARLFAAFLRDPSDSMYRRVAVAEQGLKHMARTHSRTNLARVYSALLRDGLPHFLVWNILVVLERNCKSSLAEHAVETRLDKLLALCVNKEEKADAQKARASQAMLH